MAKNQKIVFSFDDRSYESLDKMIEQGCYPSEGKLSRDDYREVEVKNPETGEVRIIIIPKKIQKGCFP